MGYPPPPFQTSFFLFFSLFSCCSDGLLLEIFLFWKGVTVLEDFFFCFISRFSWLVPALRKASASWAAFLGGGLRYGEYLVSFPFLLPSWWDEEDSPKLDRYPAVEGPGVTLSLPCSLSSPHLSSL
jgi:hypothetical protein